MAKKQPLYPHVSKNKVQRMPQTLPEDDGRKDRTYLALTREQVTKTIISNLIQAGVLLQSETDRYRKVLETYDDMTLLRVLVHSHELKEARYG